MSHHAVNSGLFNNCVSWIFIYLKWSTSILIFFCAEPSFRFSWCPSLDKSPSYVVVYYNFSGFCRLLTRNFFNNVKCNVLHQFWTHLQHYAKEFCYCAECEKRLSAHYRLTVNVVYCKISPTWTSVVSLPARALLRFAGHNREVYTYLSLWPTCFKHE